MLSIQYELIINEEEVERFNTSYALAKYALSLLNPDQLTELLDDYCVYCGKYCQECKTEIQK
jgi:hypothetical protein